MSSKLMTKLEQLQFKAEGILSEDPILLDKCFFCKDEWIFSELEEVDENLTCPDCMKKLKGACFYVKK